MDVKDCHNVQCEYCQRDLCIIHSKQFLTLIVAIEPDVYQHHFCSGICHSLWTLVEIKDKSDYFGSLEKSWLPVIKQLESELSKWIMKK